MLTPSKKPVRRRRYPVNWIKQSASYDAGEIAKLFGIHPNSVRHWLKGGLKPIDDRRPVLVHGSTLKTYLSEKQEAKRQKCGPGEFYCFRCRAPRKPWANMADAAPHTEKIIKLTALCSVCETKMHRTIRRADLPKFAALIEIREMASERLTDRPKANDNCDFEEEYENDETQRPK
jgi:hypothetical protein